MMRLLAIVIGSTAFWWASGDWSCVLVFVVPACLAVDYFLEPLIPIKKPSRRTMARLALTGGIGIVAGNVLRVTPKWAFHEALAIEVPAGVDVQRIHRHYEGGPGENTLIIEFKADKNAIQALLEAAPPDKDGKWKEKWQQAGANWTAAWEVLCKLNKFPFSRWSWNSIAPMTQPVMHEFGFNERHADVILLWDPTTTSGVLLQERF